MMKKYIFLLILLFSFTAFASPPSVPSSSGTTLSCTTNYPVLGTGQCGSGALGTGAYATIADYQPTLSLIKGTYTNGYLCTYTTTGTLLDCNTNPATFQAAGSYLTAASIASSISDSDTTHAPDGNSVFDALALKAPLASPSFTGTVSTDDVEPNENSGTSKTIDWTKSNSQSITTTGSCTLTFIAPPKPTSLRLIITHEASATAYTYSWPATVKWPAGTAITTTNASGAEDIVGFWFNGTNYYATGINNFF
jgi:hypothetical protein